MVGVRYVGDCARGVETSVLQMRLRVWGVRGVPPDAIPEAFSESEQRSHRIDFGEVVPFVK